MKRFFLPLFLLLLVGAGVAWYTLWPVSVSIPLTRVETTLGQYLAQKPLSWNNLFQLRLTQPRLSPAGDNRLRVATTGELKPPLFQTLRGELVLVTGLRYKASTGEFFLTDPQMEKFGFKELPAQLTEPLRQMANDVLPPVFSQIPVYRLNPDQLPERALKSVLLTVNVKQEQIEIVFQNRYFHRLLSPSDSGADPGVPSQPAPNTSPL